MAYPQLDPYLDKYFPQDGGQPPPGGGGLGYHGPPLIPSGWETRTSPAQGEGELYGSEPPSRPPKPGLAWKWVYTSSGVGQMGMWQERPITEQLRSTGEVVQRGGYDWEVQMDAQGNMVLDRIGRSPAEAPSMGEGTQIISRGGYDIYQTIGPYGQIINEEILGRTQSTGPEPMSEYQQWQKGFQQQQLMAQMATQPASWLQYALMTGEQPVVQPWMLPLMAEQYGLQAGMPLPGWMPGAPATPEQRIPGTPGQPAIPPQGFPGLPGPTAGGPRQLPPPGYQAPTGNIYPGGWESRVPQLPPPSVPSGWESRIPQWPSLESPLDWYAYQQMQQPQQGFAPGTPAIPGVPGTPEQIIPGQEATPPSFQRELMPELGRPSLQYWSRLPPSARAQYLGYEQTRTGAPMGDIQWRLWANAPPGGRWPGFQRVR